MYAFIQPWMLQPTEIGVGRATMSLTSTSLPGGISGLRFGPAAPPMMLALWGILAEFFTTSVWPWRRATTGGSNRQQGWSISTLALVIFIRSGWIGRAESFLSAEVSQTMV